jgi:hypothetical protein
MIREAEPRPRTGDGLDSSGHGILISLVEPRRLVKCIVSERIGIHERALEASASSRNQ